MQKFVERPALREALIEGRLTGSSLIEIYKAENDAMAIRPLTEEGFADWKIWQMAEAGTTNLSRQEKWRFAETAAG